MGTAVLYVGKVVTSAWTPVQHFILHSIMPVSEFQYLRPSTSQISIHVNRSLQLSVFIKPSHLSLVHLTQKPYWVIDSLLS